MQIDPKAVEAWVKLALLIAGSLGAAWQWLIKPLRDEIRAEAGAREEADELERDARKAADGSRDERTREMADKMQAAIGRVEVIERNQAAAGVDRQQLHSDIDSLRTAQELETQRLRDVELKYERAFGELKTLIAQTETRLNDTVRNAIEKASMMNRAERRESDR